MATCSQKMLLEKVRGFGRAQEVFREVDLLDFAKTTYTYDGFVIKGLTSLPNKLTDPQVELSMSC